MLSHSSAESINKASKIPARYVHGTIDVPPEDFKNWVEAATDFQPSRGAINQDADTWVQLDPS